MKITRNNLAAKLATLLVATLLSSLSFAGVNPLKITDRMENAPGNTVTIGFGNQVNLSTSSFGVFKDSLVTGIVQLAVNHNTDKFEAPYDAEVTVDVTTYDISGNPSTNQYKLIVKNQMYSNSPYQAEDIRIYNDQSNKVYRIETKIIDIKVNYVNGPAITEFPNNMYLETRIEYVRYDDFMPYSNSSNVNTTLNPIDLDCNNFNESIQVSWNTIPGATEYQLEWAFINDYDKSALVSAKNPTMLAYNFKTNSTRITTQNTNFTIPIIADRGYFIARVRGVGRSMSALALPIYGQWNVTSENGFISALTSSQKYQITSHFEINKNWQYNVTYAEEGKHKDVISYYDGSLRNRQSITQTSTDTTTLVGETIYDFTGRGAITVLPAPLPHKTCVNPVPNNPAYSFNYIHGFNKAIPNYVSASPHPYTKKDFDLVDPVNTCTIQTTPMSSTSGASNYYSPANPEKNNQQAFVPDAKEFPFTQTEYTPDNTGRIRRQSGVGINHQLGTDHETKYYYSVPTQIELDRLFGSEVGNAAHYQKNMIVDANNQISITYLDMAGKTIATALAGSAPPNLQPVSSFPANSTTLTADLFNKDLNGKSVTNQKNALADAIEFNSTFLVTTQSSNSFTYDIAVDTVGNACLKPNICFSCVYDLDIKVLDECGLQLYPPVGTTTPKTIGNFTVSQGQIAFKTQCSGPSMYNFVETFTTPYSLKPGVYTISKTLRINKDARDFYLANYLSKTNNLCFKDSIDFLNEELAKMDTTDCFISCVSCFASLGKKDDFVALGRGSELEWQALYEACGELCALPKTKCEIAYEQMLADVSPGGQYGEIKVSGSDTLNAGAFPLSIYNINNNLPNNIIAQSVHSGIVTNGNAHWQKPEITINGTVFTQYFDKSGQRSKIMLVIQPGSIFPGGYNLHVVNTALVYPGAAPGTFYTYPENLSKLEDFISRWNPNWAKSLVGYHPEYCYYSDCIELSKKQGSDTLSSEDFDRKLMSANTLNDAVAKGLLIPAAGGYNFNINADPFTTNSVFNPYSALLTSKYNNYNTNWGTTMSMLQFAASMARCGTMYGQSPFSINGCTYFGSVVSGNTAYQDSIHNQEWNTLKSLYLSEKNKLQIQYSVGRRSNTGCQTYNDCIGNTDFDVVSSGLWTPTNSSHFSRPYYQTQQPCNSILKDFYKNKTKRFGAISDLKALDENEAEYQTYLKTGMCRNAWELQDLMTHMAQKNLLTATSETLINHPQFTNNLYNYLNNSVPALGTYTNYLWKATSTSPDLTISFHNVPANLSKGSILITSPSAGFNWNTVKGFAMLQVTSPGSPGSNFSIMLKVQAVAGGSITDVPTTGSTSILLDGCKFKEECKANDFAKDLQFLMNALKNTSTIGTPDFNSNTWIPLNSTTGYDLLNTQTIKNVLGDNNTLYWRNNPLGSNTYELSDIYYSGCSIIIKLNSVVPSNMNLNTALASIVAFHNIRSDYQNFFTMDGKAANGVQVATLKGEIYKVCGTQTTAISMGKCDLPAPFFCRSKFHTTRNDLEELLSDILEQQKFTPGGTSSVSDVVFNPLFTHHLKSFLNPLNNNIVATASTYTTHTYIKNIPVLHDSTYSGTITNNVLNIPFGPNCHLSLKTNNAPWKPILFLGNLVNVEKLVGYGQNNNSANYNQFYIKAVFSTTSGLKTDTLFGTSCLNIQNCSTCESSSITCESLYARYLTALTNYAAHFYYLISDASDESAQGENNSPALPQTRILRYSYEDFVNKNYCCPDDNYSAFLNYILTLENFESLPSQGFLVSYPIPNAGACAPVPITESINPANSQEESGNTSSDESTYAKSSNEGYSKYKTALEELNTKYSWKPGTENYVSAAPYEVFSNTGFNHALNVHLSFIENFNPELDNKIYLNDLTKFYLDYGYQTNPKREYERYSKATELYNAKANTKTKLQTISEDTFIKQDLAESVTSYINYLFNAQTQNSLVKSLNEFDATTDAGTSEINNGSDYINMPTDSCQLLYQQYLTAYEQYLNDAALYPDVICAVINQQSYEEFVANKYCCSSAAYAIFKNYIDTFKWPYNSNGEALFYCPQPITQQTVCQSPCELLYAQYTEAYEQFMINYGAANGHVPYIPFYSMDEFIEKKFCCSDSSLIAFQNYINSFNYPVVVNSTLTGVGNGTAVANPNEPGVLVSPQDPTVSIDPGNGGLIFEQIPGPISRLNYCDSRCEQLYTQYTVAIQNFVYEYGQVYAESPAIEIYSLEEFITKKFCCSETSYIAFQQYINSIDNLIILDPEIQPFPVEPRPEPAPIQRLTNCDTPCEQLYEEYSIAYDAFVANLPEGESVPIKHTLQDFLNNKYCCSENSYNKFRDYIALFTLMEAPVMPAPITPLTGCDPCEALYQEYLVAYNQYVPNPHAAFPRPYRPRYTLQDFINNNYCCSEAGRQAFKTLIESYYSSNHMVAKLISPRPNCIGTPGDCVGPYLAYLSAITNYNSSAYALANTHSLSTLLYPSFYSFSKAGYCNCINAYLSYLNAYISAESTSNLPLPVSINNYTLCGPLKPVDECADKYNQYILTVNAYNNAFTNGLVSYSITNIYNSSQFKSSGNCYCVDGYVSFLQSVLKGFNTVTAATKSKLDVASFCKYGTKPCDTENRSNLPLSPQLGKQRNPCVLYKRDLAAANANLAYQQYLTGLTTDFVKQYNEHCLGATENFLRQYEEKEFHHTLYYYDQAGNLIRTIPPAGVDMSLFASITNPASPNEIKIQEDRTYNTHKFTTDHNLATTYIYNSLNQLVRQNMPDHDQMTYTKNQLTSGLDDQLVVVNSQFVSTNKGFLVGYKPVPAAQNIFSFPDLVRGMAYETNDGGANWQLVNSPVGANLRKVQFVTLGTNTVGFAVGSDGTYLVSYDKGNNWDLVPIHGFANNLHFTDLSFNPDLSVPNALHGFLVGENGLIIRVNLTTAGTPSYAIANTINPSGTFASNAIITSITYNVYPGPFPLYYISVLDPTSNLSKIYVSDINTNSWYNISEAQAPDLNKVVNVNGSVQSYYACGVDGTLLKFDNSTQKWNKVLSNTKGNFKDIYFMDDNGGIAIIEDLPNGINGSIYKTTDGGKNWNLLDAGITASGAYYLTLNPYIKGLLSGSSTSDKLIACGTNGLIKRITILKTGANNYSFGAVNTSILTGATINQAMVVPYNGGKQYAIAVGNSGAIYYCNDYRQNTTVWEQINSVPATLNASKIVFDIKSPNSFGPNTIINGVILDNSGNLFRIVSTSLANPTPTFVVGSILQGSGNYSFNDLQLKNYSVNGNLSNQNVYLLGKNFSDTKIGTLSLSGSLTATSAPTIYPAIVTTNQTALTSFAINSQTGNDNIITVGLNGAILTNTNSAVVLPSGTGIGSWNVKSNQVILSKINDLTVAGSGSTAVLIAVGDNGLFAARSVSAPSSGAFVIKTSGTLNRLNASKNLGITTVLSGLVVGSNGYMSKYSSSAAQNLTLNPITSSNTSDLNDVEVNISSGNNYAYAVGNNGKVVAIKNLTTTPVVTLINTNTVKNLNSVINLPGSANVLAVGDNMQAFVLNFGTALKQRSWFNNEITKIHFANSLNGYLVGKKGLIRHTNNGGADWSVVKPYYNSTNPVIDHYALFTLAPDNAVIGGEKNYLAKINNLNLQGSTTYNIASNIQLNDLAFNGSTGYAVGINGPNGYAVASNNSGTSWTLLNLPPITTVSGLNALHVFKDNAFITVGDSKKVVVYSSISGTAQALNLPGSLPPTLKLNDVIFLDDKNGYIAANAGNLIHTSDFVKSPASAIWRSVSLVDTWLTTSTTNININTISFSDRYDAFIGGTTSTVNKYARQIHDESGKFSSLFWYDRLGRMVVSQNTKQRHKPTKTYSYTLYDNLGRIVEVGEKAEQSTTSNDFENIFGAWINNVYNTNTIDDAKLTNWINNVPGNRREVTKTYYDVQSVLSTTQLVQENLRKRVATITYENLFDGNDQTYQHATHYSYDIHGNVKTLLQDNMDLQTQTYIGPGGSTGHAQRFKRIDYEYDLISGKVNTVMYQKNELDQFYHRYNYDSDNRITEVETSRNGVIWEKDAKYFYYKHGPLARTELGQDKVQGTDYAYTIQGWIKGVNSNMLIPGTDMGADGGVITLPNGQNNANHLIGRDATGYTLGYFNDDYEPIDPSKWTAMERFEANTTGSALLAARNDLHNGNISHMVTTITDVTNYTNPTKAPVVAPLTNGNAYMYDQLNRLLNSTAFDNLDVNKNDWSGNLGAVDMYKNAFTYDANGNILTQKKHDQSGTQFEDLTYNYFNTGGRLKQNRLYHVDDAITNNGLQSDDIEDQGVFKFNNGNQSLNPADYSFVSRKNNYRYDSIGNLVSDSLEDIQNIEWTIQGKIKRITRKPGSTKKNLVFDYDVMGNRIAKHVLDNSSALENSIYYVRDAQGNVMGTYKYELSTTVPSSSGSSFRLAERNIYGSSRLGLDMNEVEFIGAPVQDPTQTQRLLGDKHYELTNHLGNVLSSISDRKIAVDDNNDLVTDYYLADVNSSTDYYPFGSPMPGRSSNGNIYRYRYNGKENINEISGDGNVNDFGNRIQDGRLGRFFSLDKYYRKYPNESNYSFASNNPISAIDLNGDSTYLVIYGASYLNYTMAGGSHDVGKGFLLNAQALKNKIESSSTFDPNRDEVVLVYAPTASRFMAATNTKYKSGKIASMTVFSHGYGFSSTNGTNTGGISLGGEKPGEVRPNGTTATQAEADAQKNNYDLREVNGNNVGGIDKSNFESTATCTFYGCWIGGDQSWTDNQIKSYSFGQRFANTTGITTKAFTGSGLFKTGSNGKNLYDGSMIRAIDAKSQKTKLSIFKPNTKPTIVRK